MPDMLDAFVQNLISSVTTDFARYFIAAGAMAAILWMADNWADLRRIQKRRASFADLKREFLSSARSCIIYGVVGFSTFLMIDAGWVNILQGPLHWGWFTAQLVAMIIAHDAYFYWMHRGLHTKVMFRISHLHHHKSRTPTPWTAYSFSSIEAVTEALFVPIFLLLVPMYSLGIFIFLGHQIIRNVVGHSGHEVFPAGWLNTPLLSWFNPVTHHDIHHTEGKYNFGLYFRWWDQIMGTEHPQYEERFNAVARPFKSPVAASATFSILATSVMVVFTSSIFA